MGLFAWLKIVFILQLFYGFGITNLVYAIENQNVSTANLDEFKQAEADLNAPTLATRLQANISDQTSISIVDVGALVYFTGNIVIDLILNTFTAVPSIITLLIAVFAEFVPFNGFLINQFKMVVYVFISVMYAMNILAFFMESRSGRSVV